MSLLTDIFASHPFWAWVGVAAALLAAEAATGSGWLLWPAASAAVVAVVARFAGLDPTPAWGLFAGLTIVTTFVARRYLPIGPGRHGHDINDNIARLVGQQGRAVAAFRDRRGRVFIDGKEWAAELSQGAELDAGARVEVVGVDGARLTVRAA